MTGMKKICIGFAIFLFLSLFAHAGEQMKMVKEWEGPYPSTAIYKFSDTTEGVVCYIYAPIRLRNSISATGYSYEANEVGSISCVKTAMKSKSSDP